MRKSERLRMLEMQVLRLEFELEVINAMLSTIIDNNHLPMPDLDAGKWYKRKLEDNR